MGTFVFAIGYAPSKIAIRARSDCISLIAKAINLLGSTPNIGSSSSGLPIEQTAIGTTS
jgi:hypothetical protein